MALYLVETKATGGSWMTEREGRGADRRSAWTDPHFWVPIAIQALISFAAIVTIIANTRSDITTLTRTIDELKGQVSTLQSLATVTTEQRGDIKALDARVGKLENFESTQTQAYNFNFSTRLAGVEAKVGVRRADKKEGD
jgi:hypothetical protein